MHDVFAIYARPADPEAFDHYYATVHVPLTLAMPDMAEFTWGKVDSSDAGAPYVIARMTWADLDSANRSLGSEQGAAAVDDLANFAEAGVVVHHVPRQDPVPA